jgi:hypothetical protein
MAARGLYVLSGVVCVVLSRAHVLRAAQRSQVCVCAGIMPPGALGSILSVFQRAAVLSPTWSDLRRLELILEIPTNLPGYRVYRSEKSGSANTYETSKKI